MVHKRGTLPSSSPRRILQSIPRGGADDESSSSSAPDMSSLLSGMGMPGGGAPPSPEEMQKSMEQFSSMLSSPQFKEMLNDPEKLDVQLETMRQSLLGALQEMEKGDNPMMKMMMEQMKQQLASSFPGGWDGLKAMIEDQAQWKEMMGGLVEVVKNMGEEEWAQIMGQMGGDMPGMGGGMPGMGGMGGMGGMPGLGDTAGTLAGLDDLAED